MLIVLSRRHFGDLHATTDLGAEKKGMTLTWEVYSKWVFDFNAAWFECVQLVQV